MPKGYTGYSNKTAENLLLDAGAFYVNYDPAADTPEVAKTAGKLLGATRGGGEFSAIPEIRSMEVDGVKGRAKGLQVIDAWEIKMIANVLEVTKDGLSKALTASKVDTETNATHDIITAKNYIDLEDYIDNITYIGKISGSEQPVMIQIFNAINTTGLSLKTEDKNEAVIAMEFQGHYDVEELDAPPFKIFYPKTTTTTTATA